LFQEVNKYLGGKLSPAVFQNEIVFGKSSF
jgi:hypothetical protein